MKNIQYQAVARQLATGTHADFLDAVIEGFFMKWSKERLVKEDEFSTLMAVAEREGRIKAFQMLKDEIDRIAQGND